MCKDKLRISHLKSSQRHFRKNTLEFQHYGWFHIFLLGNSPLPYLTEQETYVAVMHHRLWNRIPLLLLLAYLPLCFQQVEWLQMPKNTTGFFSCLLRKYIYFFSRQYVKPENNFSVINFAWVIMASGLDSFWSVMIRWIKTVRHFLNLCIQSWLLV